MCGSTLITGLAKGISPLGALIDPLNLSNQFVKKPAAPPPPDPAVERATAEALAAQRANAQLAESNRRRREQGSLLAKGAPATPQFNFGDSSTSGPSNVLDSTGMTTRSSTARTASLMSRGTPSTISAPGGANYGRGGSGGGSAKFGNVAL